MLIEPTDSIAALATPTCAELFDGDANAEREYREWLDEQDKAWALAFAAAVEAGL